MITTAALQWITTLLFGFCLVYCIGLLRTHRQAVHLVDHTAHLLMAVFMIAMVWPWGLKIPLAPQGALFIAATAWFAVTALLALRRPQAQAQATHPHHGAGQRTYHALMMASMVWMIAVMAGWVGGSGHSQASGHGEHMPGMDMANMDMPGMAAETAPWWVDATTMLTVAMFTIATVVWIYRAFAAEQRSSLTTPDASGGGTAVMTATGVSAVTLAAMSEVAMAAGMAIMMGALL